MFLCKRATPLPTPLAGLFPQNTLFCTIPHRDELCQRNRLPASSPVVANWFQQRKPRAQKQLHLASTASSPLRHSLAHRSLCPPPPTPLEKVPNSHTPCTDPASGPSWTVRMLCRISSRGGRSCDEMCGPFDTRLGRGTMQETTRHYSARGLFWVDGALEACSILHAIVRRKDTSYDR
jgi:hypothetical protein